MRILATALDEAAVAGASHLDSPVAALRRMAAACEGVLLIETMLCDSARPVVVLVDEVLSSNQALEGLASRPSPSFVAMALDRIGFRHVYGATVAPQHPDFQFEWLASALPRPKRCASPPWTQRSTRRNSLASTS